MAVMVVEDRLSDSLRVAEIGVLSRGIHKTPVWVPSQIASQPEDVIGSFGTGRQEDDTEARTRAECSALSPVMQHPVLVGFVAEDLGADALLALTVERFCGVVDLEDQIENSLGEGELDVEVGLLAMLADGESESAIASGFEDLHSPLVTNNQRVGDDLSCDDRVSESGRGDLVEGCSWGWVDVLWEGSAIAFVGEAVVRHQSPATSFNAQRRSTIDSRLPLAGSNSPNLDNLGVPALASMSNLMTETQGEKVIRFAQQLGINRVNLMFDCERSGTDGAKAALWLFAERGIDVRLIWSPTMHSSEFNVRQPESVTARDIGTLLSSNPTV